jgi:hypothetical protein
LGVGKEMSQTMLQAEEIKSAITSLPLSELVDFGEWFRRFEAQVWDAQIEADIKAGKLDRLAEEALADFEANRCIEL